VYSAATPLGSAFLRATYSLVGESFNLANGGSGLYQARYSLVVVRTGLRRGHWITTLSATNVFTKVFNRAANYGVIVW
jgi:hypothetical protein